MRESNIDNYIVSRKDISNICVECDCHSGLHACLECGEEIASSDCKSNGGICNACVENELNGMEYGI